MWDESWGAEWLLADHVLMSSDPFVVEYDARGLATPVHLVGDVRRRLPFSCLDAEATSQLGVTFLHYQINLVICAIN